MIRCFYHKAETVILFRTEELSETCRVSFQKQIWEISASSWFHYKKVTTPVYLTIPALVVTLCTVPPYVTSSPASVEWWALCSGRLAGTSGTAANCRKENDITFPTLFSFQLWRNHTSLILLCLLILQSSGTRRRVSCFFSFNDISDADCSILRQISWHTTAALTVTNSLFHCTRSMTSHLLWRWTDLAIGRHLSRLLWYLSHCWPSLYHVYSPNQFVILSEQKTWIRCTPWCMMGQEPGPTRSSTITAV
jgi:hypothetical protein